MGRNPCGRDFLRKLIPFPQTPQPKQASCPCFSLAVGPGAVQALSCTFVLMRHEKQCNKKARPLTQLHFAVLIGQGSCEGRVSDAKQRRQVSSRSPEFLKHCGPGVGPARGRESDSLLCGLAWSRSIGALGQAEVGAALQASDCFYRVCSCPREHFVKQ